MTDNYSIRTPFTLLQSTGRREFKARFVRAGQVRGGGNKLTDVIIEADALKTAVDRGMFEGKAVFLDHTGMFDYPSVKNLAGVTLRGCELIASATTIPPHARLAKAKNAHIWRLSSA